METLGSVRIGLIGAGRLAWSLGPALVRAGCTVTAVSGRDPRASATLAETIGKGSRSYAMPRDVLDAAELVFLTVPDGMIRPVSDSLPWLPHHRAVHCSGALPLDALSAATSAGAEVGTFHPIQTFPARRREPDRFTGIYCGFEGSGMLGNLLEGIALALGSRPLPLAGVNRALYHAAAVFVSNDLVALMSAASRTWALAGLPGDIARQALSPLLTATAANVAGLDLTAALTGPIARGDVGTVRAHLEALSSAPALRDLYRRLGAELLLVAKHEDPVIRLQLEGLLRDPGSD
ncbi:MAG TPA: Rossmann-like and DUF2520 domain-containing protein [Tepidiformaceae bacterium]